MAYEYVELAQEITIRRIYTVHYFEYMNDFYYAGESHDFWEFLFVDKGAICVTAGDEHLNLKKDEIVFHKPARSSPTSSSYLLRPIPLRCLFLRTAVLPSTTRNAGFLPN